MSLAAAVLVSPGTATAALDEVNTRPLRNAVTVNGILQHERAFQRIANDNGGTRASGTPGYDASADYVVDVSSALVTPCAADFTFPFFRDLAPGEPDQVTPDPDDYATDTFEYSGSGNVTGSRADERHRGPADPASPAEQHLGMRAVGLPGRLRPRPRSLDPAWYMHLRGSRPTTRWPPGYDAVIIFNEGQPGADQSCSRHPRHPVTIPVVGLSFADGAALYAATQAGPVTVTRRHLRPRPISKPRP